MDKERCIQCDELTGGAGRGDDSLYGDNGDGPYCEECYDKTPDGECTYRDLGRTITRLRTLNAELVVRLELYDRVVSDMIEVDEPTGTDWYNLREARNLARVVTDKAEAEGRLGP